MSADQGIEGNTIKIGSFLPLSGALGGIGSGLKVGMETYIKYFNAELSGEVGGKKIDSIFLDDQFVPEKSYQAVKKLVESDKVFALVGAVGTPGISASMDYIVQKGIPFVYQGSGAPVLYAPPKRNVFPVQPSYIFEGRVMVKFIADHLNGKKIFVVYQNDEAGEGVREGIKEILPDYKRKNVTVVKEVPVDRSMTDFSPVATQIKQEQPDAVIVFAFGGLAVGVVKAAREAGIDFQKIKFLTTYVNSDPIWFLMAGNMWNDIYCGAWASPTTGDYYKNFMRVWKQYSGQKKDPSPYNIAGWIAAETFVEGLKRTQKLFGSITWNNFIKAMETFNEKGGWSGGMAYKLAFKPFNANDKTCRFPQEYLYFVVGVKKQYQLYKQAKTLEELFIKAY
ncbi:MAG: hypothetical protein A2Y41_01100 [Spirochaetes bacterium GWB1_36_13]|nr:MAG: hypothetical protein A2Y41_01100 [Spirochaetes bacterium GWB1_36_13]